MLSIALLDNDSCMELHQAGWLLCVRAWKERAVSSTGKPKILEHSTGWLGAHKPRAREDPRT